MTDDFPAAPPAEPWRAKLLNMDALVKGFDKRAPTDWVLEPLVIPGSLAVIAGQGGSGKTWVMHEAAHAVATGTSRAGMSANHGGSPTLIVDGEMGEWLTVQRFAEQGYSTSIQVLNAQGMNLNTPEGRQELYNVIVGLGPAFIGFDSLSALTSGADENSRETGDLVRWIRNVCNEQGAAGLLIHHAGWKEERTRGSTTIRDAADTVWYFKRADEDGTRELNCDGVVLKAPRWCRPPAPLYMRLRDEGGLVEAGKPVPADVAKAQGQEERLCAALRAPGSQLTSQGQAAEAAGLSRGNAKAGKQLLERVGARRRGDGVYELGDPPPSP